MFLHVSRLYYICTVCVFIIMLYSMYEKILTEESSFKLIIINYSIYQEEISINKCILYVTIIDKTNSNRSYILFSNFK